VMYSLTAEGRFLLSSVLGENMVLSETSEIRSS
jgi:hypothetical protein